MKVWKYEGVDVKFCFTPCIATYFNSKNFLINSYTPKHPDSYTFNLRAERARGGQGWIRTTELRREQIYSLLSLAT